MKIGRFPVLHISMIFPSKVFWQSNFTVSNEICPIMAEEKKNPKQGQLNIELNEEVAAGTYSNLCIITHSQSEFVLDFIRMMPGMPKAQVKSRIILTPQHAKRLLKALGENINRFEAQHGSVTEANVPEMGLPMNFGGPTGEA